MTLRIGALTALITLYVIRGIISPVLRIGKNTPSVALTPGSALLVMALTFLEITALLYLSGYIGAGR